MDGKTAQFRKASRRGVTTGDHLVQKLGCFVELFEWGGLGMWFFEGPVADQSLEEAAGARCIYLNATTRSWPSSTTSQGGPVEVASAKPKELIWQHGRRVRVRAGAYRSHRPPRPIRTKLKTPNKPKGHGTWGHSRDPHTPVPSQGEWVFPFRLLLRTRELSATVKGSRTCGPDYTRQWSYLS